VAKAASAGFAVLDGGLLRAKSSRLGGAAAATEPAVRTRLDDLLESPVLPSDGLIGAGVSYRYHHIDEFEPGLEVGSVVRRGDVFGTMGSTGNARNPHLHFEVRPDGTGASAVDPVPLLPFPIDGVILGEPTGCA
jgi:hypothetical protein